VIARWTTILEEASKIDARNVWLKNHLLQGGKYIIRYASGMT
jgi:hypothetical protein